MYIMADTSSNKNAYSLLTMTNTEQPHSHNSYLTQVVSYKQQMADLPHTAYIIKRKLQLQYILNSTTTEPNIVVN